MMQLIQSGLQTFWSSSMRINQMRNELHVFQQTSTHTSQKKFSAGTVGSF